MAAIKLHTRMPWTARDGTPGPPRTPHAYCLTSILIDRGLAASFFGSVIESTPLR